MGFQPIRQALHDRRVSVIKPYERHTRFGKRCGYGRADAPASRDKNTGMFQHPTFTQHTAHKAFSVEHIPNQTPIGRKTHCIAGTGDFRRDHDLVQQADGGDFVRHGDQRTMDIGKTKHERQKLCIVLSLAAHRHNHRIDLVLVKIRIVNHRCPKGFGRVTDMGNHLCLAGNHQAAFPLSPALRTPWRQSKPPTAGSPADSPVCRSLRSPLTQSAKYRNDAGTPRAYAHWKYALR